MILLLLLLLLITAGSIRLWWILPRSGQSLMGRRRRRKKKGWRRSVVAMAVLGSGGHTSELLNLIKYLDPKKYRPLHLVRADTDLMSHNRSKTELNHQSWNLVSHTIPRSREVGQSWFSTLFSSLRAFSACITLVFRVNPDVLFCNGPGTCVPVCLSCFLMRFLGINTSCKIVFVESFCRSQSLSLSGRLLYPFVDRFVVHWDELAKSLRSRGFSRVEFLGTLF